MQINALCDKKFYMFLKLIYVTETSAINTLFLFFILFYKRSIAKLYINKRCIVALQACFQNVHGLMFLFFRG